MCCCCCCGCGLAIGGEQEYLKALIEMPAKITQCSLVLEFFEATKFDIQPPSAEEREKKAKPLLKKILSVASEKGDNDSGNDTERELAIGDGTSQ